MTFLGLLLFLWAGSCSGCGESAANVTPGPMHFRLALLFGVTAIPAVLVAMFAISMIDYSLARLVCRPFQQPE